MKRVMIRLVKYLMSIVVFDVCLWMLLCRKIGILFIKCMYLINYSLYHRTIITFFSGYPFLIKSYNSIQEWTFRYLIFLFFVLPLHLIVWKLWLKIRPILLPLCLSIYLCSILHRLQDSWIFESCPKSDLIFRYSSTALWASLNSYRNNILNSQERKREENKMKIW